MHGEDSPWFKNVVPMMQMITALPEEKVDETVKITYLDAEEE